MAWNELKGEGKDCLETPEWQIGISGIPRDQAPPASKLIQLFNKECGLQSTMTTSAIFSLLKRASIHCSPPGRSLGDELTKTMHLPVNDSSIQALSARANGASSL